MILYLTLMYHLLVFAFSINVCIHRYTPDS